MATYDTEEERIEAIQKWWKENGTAIILGALLGIGLLLGWRGWVAYQNHRAESASTYYVQLTQAAQQDEAQRVFDLATQLRDDYSDTPYAFLAALEAAKFRTQTDLDAASQQLRWVMDKSGEEALQKVARLRLARVFVARDLPEEALNLLSIDWPDAYLGLVEETRGDAWRAQGQIDKARVAYNKALFSGGGDSEYLRMKLDDLGEPSAEENPNS